METIKLSDWLTMLAIVAAPLLALQIQKILDRLKERRKQQLSIFYSLMATRGTRLSPRHVEALNMIDLEFYGRKFLQFHWPTKHEIAIREAWKVYLDQLNTTIPDGKLDAWTVRGNELFADLLSKMAEALGYHFDQVQLNKGAYFPKGHFDLEQDQQKILKGLTNILSGAQALPIKITSVPTPTPDQKRQESERIALPATPVKPVT